MITRVDMINSALKETKGSSYLEIGIRNGSTFKKIKSSFKTGVDPVIKNSRLKFKTYFNLRARLYEETSDTFFAEHAEKRFRGRGIDVAFVDGMHSYGQTLKDVENILCYLNEGGLIFMHDCNPACELSAVAGTGPEAVIEKSGGKVHTWNGDVWKTIVHLRSMDANLSVFVLDFDQGIGVICRGENDNLLGYSAEEIEKMTYADLDRDRENMLNLKDESYFQEFIEGFKVQ